MEQGRLKTEKIPKLLLSLALPAICAQIVTLLYNLVDRIYIGRMENGLLAMGAIGICAPVVTMVTAFTGLFGRGGSPLAAIHMGKGDNEKAEKYLGTSVGMLIITSILITGLVMGFKQPLLKLFGASEAILPYGDDYMSIYCLGTVFVQLTVGMNYYITPQGFAKTAMATTMLGGALNIVLDPLFIFTLKMGIKGAAIATVISQLASFLWAASFMLGKKTLLHVRISNLKPDLKILKEIVILGSAPFFMNASEGIMTICFNTQVQKFGGDTAVSAMTILFSVFQFMLLPVEGVAQGSQPIIGYNYGAGEYGRVKEAIHLALISTLIFTMIGTTVVMICPESFIRIFNSSQELIQLGSGMLRVYVVGMFVLGANSTFQQTYNSLGEGGKAFFFAFYRKVIILIPMLYVFPAVLPWGVMAVVLAEPVADLITTGTNALYFHRFIKKKLFTSASPH